MKIRLDDSNALAARTHQYYLEIRLIASPHVVTVLINIERTE